MEGRNQGRGPGTSEEEAQPCPESHGMGAMVQREGDKSGSRVR